MVTMSMKIAVLLAIATLTPHGAVINVYGKYTKRSTENQAGSAFKQEDGNLEPTATNFLKPPDDVTFKQEDINPESVMRVDDAPKPVHDFTLKQGESLKVSDDITLKQVHTNLQSPIGQNTGIPFAFNLPPWLMFFRPMWSEVMARENELRTQFPREFEIENDVTEPNELDTDWNEGTEAVSDDATETDDTFSPSFEQDGAAGFPEGPELPDIFEPPESNFETGETGSNFHESIHESSTPDDTEQTQEIDNTEPEALTNDSPFEPGDLYTPETNTGLESFSNQGNFGFPGGNWMNGMANTAIGVLNGHNGQFANDDSPDIPDRPDRPDIPDNSINHGMVFTNLFAPSAHTFINNFEHNSVNGNEQDSSS